MSIVKLVNTSNSMVHVACVDKVLPPGGFFAISEKELESKSELLTCLAGGILKQESLTAAPDPQAVEDPESANDDEEGEIELPVDVEGLEESQGIKLVDEDKGSSKDEESAFLKYDNRVVKVDPLKANVGRDSDNTSEDTIDGIEILNTEKDESTISVDGIELVVDDPNEEEYGPQFVDQDSL